MSKERCAHHPYRQLLLKEKVVLLTGCNREKSNNATSPRMIFSQRYRADRSKFPFWPPQSVNVVHRVRFPWNCVFLGNLEPIPGFVSLYCEWGGSAQGTMQFCSDINRSICSHFLSIGLVPEKRQKARQKVRPGAACSELLETKNHPFANGFGVRCDTQVLIETRLPSLYPTVCGPLSPFPELQEDWKSPGEQWKGNFTSIGLSEEGFIHQKACLFFQML